jgi:Tol biopolymer transport system component
MIDIGGKACFGLCLAAVAVLISATAAAQSCVFEQVDLSSTGVQGNGFCFEVAVSGNGRYVAFGSASTNLLAGDVNGWSDAFVRDLETGSTELVSLDTSGQQGNGDVRVQEISEDGRFVVFTSWANNIDPLDADTMGDVYVRDRLLGVTELISVRSLPTPSLFHCWDAAVSADGRYVAFTTADGNVLPGDLNDTGDVFLRDRMLGTTTFVSISSTGELGNNGSIVPSISADGSRIAFLSAADNFYPNRAPQLGPKLHAFVRDRNSGFTTPVDVTPSGRLGNNYTNQVAISPDGDTVVFQSWATDLLGYPTYQGVAYVRDVRHNTTEPIPFADGRPGAGIEFTPELSWDGRFVVFEGVYPYWVAKDLNPNSDVFLRDRGTAVTGQVSTLGPGHSAGDQVRHPSVSDDGRVVAFRSKSTTLVPGSTPNIFHVFVRVCDPAPGLVFCYPTESPQGCLPSMSAQGQSSASAGVGHSILVQNTVNDQIGLFVYGTSGSGVAPFSNGFFCLQGPVTRLPAQGTGGSLPPSSDCTGALQLDFNTVIAGGQDPLLVTGTPVYLQGWTRAPNHPAGAILSNALAFVVGP